MVILCIISLEKQVKTKILPVLFIICLVYCGQNDNSDTNQKAKFTETTPASFNALTLMGEIVEFTDVLPGVVRIDDSDLEKMYQVDEQGNLKYLSSEMISYFETGSSLDLQTNYGFAICFTAPQIDEGDYLVLDVEVTLPKEIYFGEKKTGVIPIAFNFNERNSNRREYVWILFTDENPELHLEGVWNVKIFNNEILLLSQNFTVHN